MPSNESEFIKRIIKIEKWLRRLETLITRPTVSSSTGTTHDEVTVVDTATINLTLTGQQLQADLLAGGSAHVIKDEGGVGLTARGNLNFTGAGVTATDNAGTNATDVTIPGSIAVANIGSTAETVGGAVANGSAATASRSDHKHAITNPKLDDLATPDNNTDLDSNTTNHGLLLTAVAPAATLLNVPGIANGETVYTLKPMFDATHPEDLGTAAEGAQVIAARRDHVHKMPALDDLSDVNTGAPNDDEVLTWDAGSSKWVADPSAGGSVATDAIWDAKGDLAVGTGANTASKLTVGADGKYLKAASGEATGVKWDTPAGSGDVVGPAGATDGHLALFDGATGKLIKDGGAPGVGSVPPALNVYTYSNFR